MGQKLIITDSVHDVNGYLEDGWKVVSITAQHVSSYFAILLEMSSTAKCVPTYTEEEVSRLLETQRGNCYVAVYNETGNQSIARIAGAAPEPGQWRK